MSEIPEQVLEKIREAKEKELTELDLRGYRLQALPASLGELQGLTQLDLSDNRLTELPDWMAQLQGLTTLDLSDNQLTELPDWMAQLQGLTQLYLSGLGLTELPDWMAQLQGLTTLDLSRNPIENLPAEMLGNGFLFSTDIEKIRAYFRQLEEEGPDHLYEAKLLIIGEGGAGKTTLVKKIKNSKYQLQKKEKSTEGIEVTPWEFTMENGQPFRVNIWDFGGQEIYHATHQFFLTKRSLYALVADSRKEDTDFNYWLNVVELLSDNSPLLIVKNEKQDRQRAINERALRGQFTNLKDTLATNLATNRGLPEILDEIKHYVSRLPHIGTPLPKTWVDVRKALEDDDRNHIRLDEYLDLCGQKGFKLKEDKLQLSEHLHDLGVCLHFQNDPLLKKTVILNPKWGTDAVYKVLDNKTVINNLGRFTREDLAAIWHEDQYADMQDELLRLMINFKLCYEIPENLDTYIAPQLLSENQPAYDWYAANNLLLRYTYEFMPKGILTQFIVALHRWIAEQKYVWKSGVILAKDETKAEVIEHYNKREVQVRVAGRNKKALLTLVSEVLDEIHASYNRLKYDTLIPCNCTTCQGRMVPHFYTFDVLRDFVKNSQHEIQCQRKPYKMVNVLGLIDDVMDKAAVFKMPRRGEETGSDDEETLPERESEIEPENEVFILYGWGGASEEIANELDKAFQEKGITIIRDKRALGFKGRIKAFMEQIGKGKSVIVVISKKYLESENCMFELVQIARNGDFYDRIFPVVLDDAKIYKAVNRIKYVKHWEVQIQELDEAMKDVSSAYLQGFREEIDQYTEIRNTIADLTNTLKDMNTFTAAMHRESGFAALIDAVLKKLAE